MDRSATSSVATPAFAQEVEEAKNGALGRVEAAIMERAVGGVQRPIFQRGELVGHETLYSDNLLRHSADPSDGAAGRVGNAQPR